MFNPEDSGLLSCYSGFWVNGSRPLFLDTLPVENEGNMGLRNMKISYPATLTHPETTVFSETTL
jgi:hypothetical protein